MAWIWTTLAVRSCIVSCVVTDIGEAKLFTIEIYRNNDWQWYLRVSWPTACLCTPSTSGAIISGSCSPLRESGFNCTFDGNVYIFFVHVCMYAYRMHLYVWGCKCWQIFIETCNRERTCKSDLCSIDVRSLLSAWDETGIREAKHDVLRIHFVISYFHWRYLDQRYRRGNVGVSAASGSD